MSKESNICVIKNCGNPVSIRSKLQECPTCRATELRWAKRPPSHIAVRQYTLEKWQDRMTHLASTEIGKRHAKVIRKYIRGEARAQA